MKKPGHVQDSGDSRDRIQESAPFGNPLADFHSSIHQDGEEADGSVVICSFLHALVLVT